MFTYIYVYICTYIRNLRLSIPKPVSYEHVGVHLNTHNSYLYWTPLGPPAEVPRAARTVRASADRRRRGARGVGGGGWAKLGWGDMRLLDKAPTDYTKTLSNGQYKAPTDNTKPQQTIQKPKRQYKYQKHL